MLTLALTPTAVVADRPPGCKRIYNRPRAHRALRRVYRSPARLTRFELRLARRVVRCQYSRRSARRMRRHHARYKRAWHRRRRAHERRRELIAVTPYDCGSHGRYAIPCGIVACESGFSWSAHNPSGARGVYQLLNKGDPWPADTPAKRLAHHRIAYNLYSGGAGRSHWVCRG